jgi:hypothetical protein
MVIMRKVFLIFLFFFISHICSAPDVDFHLKMIKLKSLSEFVTEKYHESELSRFINDLGYRESGNNWLCVNRIGCFGEWQFDESTLKCLGYKAITLKKFKANPGIFPRQLQMEVLKTLIKVNLLILEDYIHYIGDSINGVVITKSGMIAASHLGGAGSLEKFLDSNGRINRKDIFGTSIYDYLKKFRYYDLE